MLLYLLNTTPETNQLLTTLFPEQCLLIETPPINGTIVIDTNLEVTVMSLRKKGYGNPIIGIIDKPLEKPLPLVHIGKTFLIPRTDLHYKMATLLSTIPVFTQEQCAPYLTGESATNAATFSALKNTQQSLHPLILCGNHGVGKRTIAEQLHITSIFRDRPYISLNLGTHTDESQRWAMLKNTFSETTTGIEHTTEYVPGTVYIYGFESVDVLFVVSLLEWLSQLGKSKPFGSGIRIILGIPESVQELIPQEFLQTFTLITLPSLSAHREDIPALIYWFVLKYNRQYYRHVKHIDLSLISAFMERPWSGNIEELRYNLETVFLAIPESTTTLTVEDAIIHYHI